MTIELYYHPFSRASTTLWMFEELELEPVIHFVDLKTGVQKESPFIDLNPMGKLPTIVDDGTVVTESAAIGLYLADRYAPGRLAPALDAPERGTYLRWSLYAPSVIEPGCAAKASNAEFRAGSVGWGTYESMLDTMEKAIGDGPWLLGETFSMADIIFGATIRFMMTFKMIEERPSYVAYKERIEARPAHQRATARNAAMIAEHDLAPKS